MNNITDILTKTGKATTREIAAILKIDVRDVLTMLKEHEQDGLLTCRNGHWQLVGSNAQTEAAQAMPEPAAPAAPTFVSPRAPERLKVIWSSLEDSQVFPTMTWVRQRRRELKNEMRWLSQIENIARQIERKKAAVAYFRERL